MTVNDLADRAAKLKWFHQMDLGGGVVTDGLATRQETQDKAAVYFQTGVKGLSVLDVGAWDGFYSFEAERRGASRVLAVDKFCWTGPGWGRQDGFLLAREALRSKVEDRILDISETTVANVGHFDYVLFSGIIYHIPNPLSALADMAAICTKVLTVETHLDLLDLQRPAMVFYPGETGRSKSDPKFGWGPNSLLMHALLKSHGFESVLEFPNPVKPAQRSIFLAFKPGHPFGAFVASHQEYAKPRLTSSV